MNSEHSGDEAGSSGISTASLPQLPTSLIERLLTMKDSGQRTLGGGYISHDGMGKMWGGEPIMVPRNPDGQSAVVEIGRLRAALANLLQHFDNDGLHLARIDLPFGTQKLSVEQAKAVLRAST